MASRKRKAPAGKGKKQEVKDSTAKKGKNLRSTSRENNKAGVSASAGSTPSIRNYLVPQTTDGEVQPGKDEIAAMGPVTRSASSSPYSKIKSPVVASTSASTMKVRPSNDVVAAPVKKMVREASVAKKGAAKGGRVASGKTQSKAKGRKGKKVSSAMEPSDPPALTAEGLQENYEIAADSPPQLEQEEDEEPPRLEQEMEEGIPVLALEQQQPAEEMNEVSEKHELQQPEKMKRAVTKTAAKEGKASQPQPVKENVLLVEKPKRKAPIKKATTEPKPAVLIRENLRPRRKAHSPQPGPSKNSRRASPVPGPSTARAGNKRSAPSRESEPEAKRVPRCRIPINYFPEMKENDEFYGMHLSEEDVRNRFHLALGHELKVRSGKLVCVAAPQDNSAAGSKTFEFIINKCVVKRRKLTDDPVGAISVTLSPGPNGKTYFKFRIINVEEADSVGMNLRMLKECAEIAFGTYVLPKGEAEMGTNPGLEELMEALKNSMPSSSVASQSSQPEEPQPGPSSTGGGKSTAPVAVKQEGEGESQVINWK